MIKEPYSKRYYSYSSKYISNVLSLRTPQHESLEVFARICDILSLTKKPADADSRSMTRTCAMYASITPRSRPSSAISLPYASPSPQASARRG